MNKWEYIQKHLIPFIQHLGFKIVFYANRPNVYIKNQEGYTIAFFDEDIFSMIYSPTGDLFNPFETELIRNKYEELKKEFNI